MTRFSQCAVAAIGDSHEKDERQYSLGHKHPAEQDQIGRRSRDALIATVFAIPGAKNSTPISNPP